MDAEEKLEELAQQEDPEVYMTMADVYRKARLLYNLEDFNFGDCITKAPNKLCIEHAVNIARWMPAIPRLDATIYGTSTLTWRFNNIFVSCECFPQHVRVFKCNADCPEQAYEHTQHHAQNVNIDLIFLAVVQACKEAGIEVDEKPAPWDEFEGVTVPDLDMNIIEDREQEAAKKFAESIRKQKEEMEKSGVYEQIDFNEVLNKFGPKKKPKAGNND